MKFIAFGAVLLGGILGYTAVSHALDSQIPQQASSGPSVLSDKVGKVGTNPGGVLMGGDPMPKAGDQLAAFSGGCFWGTENLYRHVKGVVATAVGYTGGHTLNPTYEDVCTHTTGHAETVLVEFDPKVVSYLDLLKTFWENHDPTTPDRQGPDVGDNYRSAIWCYTSDELKEAKASEARRQKLETAPITTHIEMAKKFWPAEEYHQQYDEKSGTNTCPIPNRVKGG